MTALGKLLRTTAFQLTLVYLVIFIVFAFSLLGYFALNTRRLITEQITTTVDTEITGLREQYNQGGIRRLVIVVDLRSRRPGSSLYLVTTATGEGLADNVGPREPGVPIIRAGSRPIIAAWKRRRATIIARWCRWCSCPAASAFWSDAI